MTEVIVAVYHTIEDRRAVQRALEEIGIAPDDIRISDYVDPVAANAPESIEKPGGLLYWLGGIPGIDIDAYRRALARGRTIVAVHTTAENVHRVAAVLERFTPVELSEAEAVPAGVEQFGTAARTMARPKHAIGRLRRYSLWSRESGP